MARHSKAEPGLESAQNASDQELATYAASLLQSLQRLFAQRRMTLLAHMCALAIVEAQRIAEVDDSSRPERSYLGKIWPSA